MFANDWGCNIVASTEQVDRVFEKMYLAGNLDTPGMGIMFTTKLEKAATFVPQEVLKKLGKLGQAQVVEDFGRAE